MKIYTDKNNITTSREARISDLRAIGDDYTIDEVNEKQRIKIGSPYEYVPVGDHLYTISYIYDMGSDPYKDFDEFIFHAFGDYWGTKIKNASVEIIFPKEIDASDKIHFFRDKYRKNDITKLVDYQVNGNKLTAKVSDAYTLTKSLTVDVELPEGYFSTGSNNYGVVSLIACMICIVMMLITLLLWYTKGKDYPKVAETVEFYPPNNLDAAEIGYLYKDVAGKKLAIAILIELASKGYIKIDESEDKNDPWIYSNIADPNSVEMTNNERLVYDILFGATTAEAKAATEIITLTEDTTSPDKLKGAILSSMKNAQTEALRTKLSTNTSFYLVFSELSHDIGEKYDDVINDIKSHKLMLLSSIMFVIGVILWGYSYCFIKDLNPKYSILYLLALISLALIFIFTLLMQRKQQEGEALAARIRGFKNFLEVAEKEQLEEQVEKYPNYFYYILPYAYVLGVSKKWIKKFENIPLPAVDMGTFDYHDFDSIDDLSDSIYYPPSSGSSSSFGCSSCGGGCSSCGGGCSSCGGGGSW